MKTAGRAKTQGLVLCSRPTTATAGESAVTPRETTSTIRTPRLERARTEPAPTPKSGGVKFSEEEERRAREVFEAYDYDGSGLIDKTELRELLVELQWCMPAQSLQDFVSKHLGLEGDLINFKMFRDLYGAMLARQPSSVRKQKAGGGIDVSDLREVEAETRVLFEEMNTRGTGYLNVDEMRNVMRASGLPDTDGDDYESVVLDHMQFADKNQDGQISFEEFVNYRNAVLKYFYDSADASGDGGAGGAAAYDHWAEHRFTD